MDPNVVLPLCTSVLSFLFALFLIDQWRERRHGFQLIWTIGMLFYGLAAGCSAMAGANGWNETLYRTWYLAGGVWTAAWLGLGTAFLLGRTRFGYAFAASLAFAGFITVVAGRKYEDVGLAPLLFLLGAVFVALAIGVETYFQNERWPSLAALLVGVVTLASLILMVATPFPPPGYSLDSATGLPTVEIVPGLLRLPPILMNITGALSLFLGAVFSAYVFMPKRRVLSYSLDPNQPGDQFLFNLAISPVAVTVNFFASLPGAVRALFAGQLHSRVPATLLIAIGAFIPAATDSLLGFLGYTALFELGKLLGVVFLFAGFLVSSEVFREIRIPFTRIRLAPVRHEEAPADIVEARE